MNFANKISIFRILSVPFFIACLMYYSPDKEYLRFVALFIFILGVISDAVDGYIARKNHQQSKAGLILDPLGDKLLLMSAFIFLSFIPLPVKFPIWVSLVVISRDVLILMGALIIFMVKQEIKSSPTKWGKFTTSFQMAAVISVLLQLPFTWLIWTAALIFTILSGVDYTMRGFKVLYALDNHRNHH